MVTLTSPESTPIANSNNINKDGSKPPAMFHFLFINIGHLISKIKYKLNLKDVNINFFVKLFTQWHW